MIKETYYAVRIGNPPRHLPYLMLAKGKSAPQLFCCEHDAKAELDNDSNRKVVRVEIREIKS